MCVFSYKGLFYNGVLCGKKLFGAAGEFFLKMENDEVPKLKPGCALAVPSFQ